MKTKHTTQNERPAQILVIDDDPMFRAMMASTSRRRNIPMTVCSSLREVNAMTVPRLFDVVIVDYYLDDMKNHLKGTQIAEALEGSTILLVSNTDHAVEESEAWPSSIRRFVNKKAGVDAILDAALTLRVDEK